MDLDELPSATSTTSGQRQRCGGFVEWNGKREVVKGMDFSIDAKATAQARSLLRWSCCMLSWKWCVHLYIYILLLFLFLFFFIIFLLLFIIIIDEALVIHQAQPPKIPSLLRIQASAAARSSSFSLCFAALSGGHSLATGPWRKKELRIRLSSAPDRLKDLKCANAKMKGKVVPQQHSPLKDPLWTFHLSARLKLLNFWFLNMPCTVADDSIPVL